jgi:hypothetical protein
VSRFSCHMFYDRITTGGRQFELFLICLGTKNVFCGFKKGGIRFKCKAASPLLEGAWIGNRIAKKLYINAG